MRRLYQDKNLQLIFAITLMAVMGVSSIVPALPDVMEGLDFTPATIGLVVSVFTLPGVILAPVVGVLADRVGRKVVLVPSLFIFGGFGFACFFAQDMTQLLVLRFFQSGPDRSACSTASSSVIFTKAGNGHRPWATIPRSCPWAWPDSRPLADFWH